MADVRNMNKNGYFRRWPATLVFVKLALLGLWFIHNEEAPVAEFKADPYRIAVRMNNEGLGLAAILRNISNLPRKGFLEEGSRWGYANGNYIEIDRVRTRPNCVVGTAFHLRMSDLDSLGGPDGPVDIALSEEQGLGKHVAFLLDTERDIFWFQRDRDALGLGKFLDYLRDKSGIGLSSKPVFDRNAINRATQLRHLKEIRFAVAYAEGAEERLRRAAHVFQFWRARNDAGGYKVEVRITAERGEVLGPSSHEMARQLIDLAESDVPELKAAEVIGYYPTAGGDQEMAINLLHDKFICSIEGVAEKIRKPTTLMSLMHFAWRLNRDKVTT